MLIQGNHVLAERRKRTKQVMPGAVALPGGHVETGEQPEQALRREVPSSMYALFCIAHRNSASCTISR
jgi:ADP-ribose pyrophosphatase YjhB (NUDIX family)